MAGFGKWLGGGLGFTLGGPIGALIGFALGAVFDDANVTVQKTGAKRRTQKGDFGASLMVLVAAVLKADNTVLKSELDYIKRFFVKNFGVENTREQMIMLRELLKQEIPLEEVCIQIRGQMEYASKLQLLHFLFGVSMADGNIHDAEVEVIQRIAQYLRINSTDYASIKAMFYSDSESDYRILEISSEASTEEVKKAYKRMALKYHPDKVSHLGEEYQHDAKDKFQKLQAAYERIKSKRGFN
jgi:DnaJ like chaperone protein